MILLSYIIISFILINVSCNNYSNDKNIQILDFVWETVYLNYYDSTYNNLNWKDEYDKTLLQIKSSNNDDSIFYYLNKMLFKLNSSHTGIVRISELDEILSPYLYNKGDIGIDIRIINNEIVISSVMPNSLAFHKGLRTGFVITQIDGYTLDDIKKRIILRPPHNSVNLKYLATAEVLRKIKGKPNSILKIVYKDSINRYFSMSLKRSKMRNGVDLDNGMPITFLKSESYYCTENIAYLKFNAFLPNNMEYVLLEYDKIIQSKGLIIDLRGNDGGSIEGMKTLIGKFITKKQKYGTYINRYENLDDYIIPTHNHYSGKVVILVDEMSISGAENMAGIFQQLNIGTVIGNKTPGQLLWGRGFLLNDTIALSLPIYQLIYNDGIIPEGNGITPDIEIKLSRNALLNNYDEQLNKAISYLDSLINIK